VSSFPSSEIPVDPTSLQSAMLAHVYRSSICRASAARRPGADQSRLVVTAIDLAVATALGVLVWNLALGGK
jgi:hypothetical protein